jgi:hypothetical protein
MLLMKTALVAAACLSLGLAGGIGAGFFLGRATAPASTAAPSPPPNYPTRAEITEYLDGKPIALTSPDTPDKPLAHTMRKDQIEAVQISDSAGSINDEPWSTRVTFILDTGHGRYAVEGQVAFRRMGDKCAFFGFTPEKTVMQ